MLSVGCNNDPYPIYQEGEVLWQMSDQVGYSSGADMEPLITPDGLELVYVNVYGKQDQFKLMKLNLFSNQQSIIHSFGYAADISPDGQWLAFNSSYGAISKIKLNGDSLQLLTANDDFTPDWSPDGTLIAFSNASCGTSGYPALCGLSIIEKSGNNKKLIGGGGVDNLWVSNDKIFAGGDGYLDISGNQIVPFEVPKENMYHVSFSTDYEKILYWNLEGIWQIDPNGNNKISLIPYKHFYESKKGDYLGFLASSPSWHPDGKHIIYQHFAITEHLTCPTGFSCTDTETFKGIVSVRKLKVRE